MSIYKKLAKSRILNRVFVERFTEPLHLNFISIFVGIFGGIKSKIKYDLILRQHNAWGLDFACREALRNNLKSFTAIEFGVASGAGLMNMHKIASRLEKAYNLKINLIGFDTGTGLPPALDYRDHPDFYRHGDYPMAFEPLRQSLPQNVKLVIGNVTDTIKAELEHISEDSPIGYIAFDLDYYSSTKSALDILKGENPKKLLPAIAIYLDDVYSPFHNDYAGVLLAVNEFNQEASLRKICVFQFLEQTRIFKNALWIKQMRIAHIMDHPSRSNIQATKISNVIENSYLNFEGNKEKFNG